MQRFSSMDLPPIAAANVGTQVPSDQHGQLLYAIGMLNGTIEGMKNELTGVKDELSGYKDAKITQNGRIGKLEVKQAEQEGQQKGISISWAVIIAISSVALGALGLYFTIRPLL